MNLRVLLPTTAVLVLLAPMWAQKQNSDWQVVKNLAPGTQISAQVGRFAPAMKCRVEDVTDGALTCAQGWPVPMQAVTCARNRIRTVRVAHNTALIGLITGAGAGAVIGVAQNPRPGLGRGGDAVISAGLLGLFGAGIGGILSPLFPGRVIYRATLKPKPPQSQRKVRSPDTNHSDPTSPTVLKDEAGHRGSSTPRTRPTLAVAAQPSREVP
jgi:hypothetical protein